jgi:hypothetical protein
MKRPEEWQISPPMRALLTDLLTRSERLRTALDEDACFLENVLSGVEQIDLFPCVGSEDFLNEDPE